MHRIPRSLGLALGLSVGCASPMAVGSEQSSSSFDTDAAECSEVSELVSEYLDCTDVCDGNPGAATEVIFESRLELVQLWATVRLQAKEWLGFSPDPGAIDYCAVGAFDTSMSCGDLPAFAAAPLAAHFQITSHPVLAQLAYTGVHTAIDQFAVEDDCMVRRHAAFNACLLGANTLLGISWDWSKLQDTWDLLQKRGIKAFLTQLTVDEAPRLMVQEAYFRLNRNQSPEACIASCASGPAAYFDEGGSVELFTDCARELRPPPQQQLGSGDSNQAELF